ncbi:hypothetical protein OSG_eHP12_00190 [environmental Halophage eHP-12]|nr:hypothetical protein OSG_eHP12_00190 [environmental Halophage eHP-12]
MTARIDKTVLIAVYAGLLGFANIAATKVIEIQTWTTWTTTAGIIPIAGAFLISDVCVERYGQDAGYRLVRGGVITLIAVIMLSQLVIRLPGDGNGVEPVLAQSTPILIASVTTITFSQWADIELFSFIRNKTDSPIAANLGSTMITSLIDTTGFAALAFVIIPSLIGGLVLPLTAVTTIIITQCVLKIGLAALDTPLFVILTGGRER